MCNLTERSGWSSGVSLVMPSQVDLRNNKVCLCAGETKNEEPVTVGRTTQCRERLTELKHGKHPEDSSSTRRTGSRSGIRGPR
jgi:hypothetical protein